MKNIFIIEPANIVHCEAKSFTLISCHLSFYFLFFIVLLLAFLFSYTICLCSIFLSNFLSLEKFYQMTFSQKLSFHSCCFSGDWLLSKSSAQQFSRDFLSLFFGAGSILNSFYHLHLLFLSTCQVMPEKNDWGRRMKLVLKLCHRLKKEKKRKG